MAVFQQLLGERASLVWEEEEAAEGSGDQARIGKALQDLMSCCWDFSSWGRRKSGEGRFLAL